jgi:hypothetical protein
LLAFERLGTQTRLTPFAFLSHFVGVEGRRLRPKCVMEFDGGSQQGSLGRWL